MKETDPRYKKINELQTNLAMATNPHMHGLEVPEDKRQELIETLRRELENEMRAKSHEEEKPKRISREEYMTEMFNTRDKTRAEAMQGRCDQRTAQGIITIIQGNIQTVCEAEACNLAVSFWKIGDVYTYDIKPKKKMGFV